MAILSKVPVADRVSGTVTKPKTTLSVQDNLARQAQIKKDLESLDKWIKILDSAKPTPVAGVDYYNISGVQLSGTPFPNISTTAVTKGTVAALRAFYLTKKSSLNNELTRLQNAPEKTTKDKQGNGSGSNKTNTKAPEVKLSKNIIYNAPAVKEAYFKSDQSFFNQAGRGDNFVFAGNTPASTVKDAIDLWNSAVGTRDNSKGMIQTWNNPANQFISSSDSGLTPVAGVGTGKIQRHGFQFIYNPTSINMEYGGVSDVDPGWAASGKEKFILSNPTVFQSTISFTIFLNRMYDMKYLKAGGKLTKSVNELYSGNLPSTEALKKIYNRGTMYDVEFLLQTMFPYAPIKTQLRNKTSDIGFLGPMPVELHLGHKLRYLVQINGISVQHAIFDNRMVPLWTSVTINANRIPDAKSGLIAS